MEGRDFKSEIDAAQNDPAALRKIADDIHASGGSRILMIRAIQLARAADNGPHPLGKICGDLVYRARVASRFTATSSHRESFSGSKRSSLPISDRTCCDRY